MVLIAEPTFPGCVVRCRALGMLCMTDEGGRDNKVLCVPAGDTRLEQLRDIMHVPEFDKLEIEHFFTVYKDLDPDKAVEGDVSWVGRSDAEAEIERAHRRSGERTALTEASDPLHGAGGQGGQR
jgi:inorganic pyrophosphatase